MKKLYLLFLLAFLPLVANADAVEIDGIYYNLNSSGETKTAEVTKNPNKYSGPVEIPATITYQSVEYKVTSVGEDAFNSCSNLTSVTIPNGVTSIGAYAFLWDSNLISVTIPSSVSTIGEGAFAFCNSLKEITLPDGLSAIEGGTFLNCSKLRKVTIPTSVTRIGTKLDDEQNDGPFNGTSLETLIVPASVQTIGQYGLWATPNTIIIMESATPPSIIHDMALEDALGSRVFSKIIVPNGSKDAYQNANVWKKYKDLIFEQGESSVRILKDVSAGTLSTLISESEKYNIDHLVITGQLNGEDFRFIREMAGSDYHGVPTDGNLTTLDLSEATIVAGGSYVEIQDQKVYYNKEKTSYIQSGGVVDGEKVSEANKIGSYLFAGCQKLQTIILPNNITSIDDFGFWATGLTAITMPNTVTSIKNGAFSGCPFITLTIPSSVTNIGDQAFANNNELQRVTVENPTPVAIYENTFSNSLNIDLIVPVGSICAYKATNYWKEFKTIKDAEGNTEDAGVTVKIGDSGYGSFCSIYDLDFTDVDGLKAYTATGYDDDNGTIWLTRVYRVPAGTGLIVKGTPGTTYQVPPKSSHSYYSNMLVGNTGSTITIYETDGDKTNYYLKNGKLLKVDGYATIGQFKSYLQVPTSVFARTRSLDFILDDENGTTYVPHIKQPEQTNDVYYNLQGQRVEHPTKGIYIRNGKKVVIK